MCSRPVSSTFDHREDVEISGSSVIVQKHHLDPIEGQSVALPKAIVGPEAEQIQASPPPSTSTDSTLVHPDVETLVAPAGQKRMRDADDASEENERSSSRPRRDSSIPPIDESSGLKALLWLPWQTFKKGFCEGIFSSSSE